MSRTFMRLIMNAAIGDLQGALEVLCAPSGLPKNSGKPRLANYVLQTPRSRCCNHVDKR